ncbi:hypothetical protein [Lysobacter enzymogenes]|uniref:hypothetical protein n=1 Tax=Lysobacter enzymogenes TaxID=69 RepID=UPI0008950EDC|nr:hypothetical protein [Lysobacter enzymogenes]SDX25516.1 hypothetical protein SAMN05421681_104381 [Lysobacter enzymogenes]
MEQAILIFGPVLVLGWNVLLWHWSRGYLRYAAVAMFALNLLVGSPLIGVLGWKLASQDVDTNYVDGYADVLVAIAVGLFNGVVALLGAIAVALRKPPAASKDERDRTGEDRRDRPR